MARPCVLGKNLVISTRLEEDMHSILHDLAALESISTGKKVTVQELIRNALKYVYTDSNERLRDSFRKSRSQISKRFKKNT